MKNREYEIKTFLVPITSNGKNDPIELTKEDCDDVLVDVLKKSHIIAVEYYTALSTLVNYAGKEVELISAKIDFSPKIFYGAKIISLSELTESMTCLRDSCYSALIHNIKNIDKVDKVIIDRFGFVYPYFEDDYKDCIFLEMPKDHLKK